MPDRASVNQVVQIGVESVSGSGVPANKLLSALSITPSVKSEVDTFKPKGQKLATVATPNKEWTEAGLEGRATYDEIIYPCSGLLGAGTVAQIMDGATGTGAYQWDWTLSGTGSVTPKTFTVEEGSSVRAHKFSYGLITGLSLTFDDGGVQIGGSMIGQRLTDGITLTASPTSVALVPVARPHLNVYLADTAAGLDSATALERAISGSVDISGLTGPIWTLNRANSSWAAHIETDPTATAKLKLAADATGMGLLSQLRSGATKFMRFEAVGDTIYSGAVTAKYTLRADLALKVKEIGGFEDSDGLYAIEYTFDVAHDSTFAAGAKLRLINKTSGL
ncbi:MAG: hypothetical protein M3P51_04580 [Chloroflexota bacterium]|nr:hypothetical protein [Chloroflexota bacterium]